MVNPCGNATPGLRLQRDDLLAQRAALEVDLSTSFVKKCDLKNELLSAKGTIEGKNSCEPETPARPLLDFLILRNIDTVRGNPIVLSYFRHPLDLAGNVLSL